MIIAKPKKTVSKCYTLYDSNNMISLEMQSYKDNVKSGKGWGMGKAQGIFYSSESTLHDTLMWIHDIMHLSKSIGI